LPLALVFLLTTQTSAASPCSVDPAITLIEAHRATEAKALLEPCMAADPGEPRAAIAYARALLDLRDEKGAVQTLERAAGTHPQNVELQLWLGRAYGQRAIHASVFEQPSLAARTRKAFERASTLDPENLEARWALVQYYLRAPNVLGGSPAKAREEAREIEKRDALRGVRAWGRIAEHEKRWVEADQIYEKATRDFPAASEPVVWRAALAARLKSWDRAFDVLERRLADQPDDVTASFELGRVAAASGQRLDRGEECLRRYLAGEPGSEDPPASEAHRHLGEIYEKKRDREAARQEYAEALRLNPMEADARAALARLR
jgi:tetratricopeptide (TPR) repeat protein